jgi:DUF971 family protein
MIEWSDGHTSEHLNTSLREACPCAACRGEPPAIGRSLTIPLIQAAPRDIAAVKHTMIGRYAISFDWSDGHSTGIYPYSYLLELCECPNCVDAARSEQ